MEHLYERLRQARRRLGITQKEVAQHLKVHRPTISQIEAGRRKVSSAELVALAQLYHVSLAWLVESDTDTDPRIVQITQGLTALPSHQLDAVVRVVEALRQHQVG